MSELVVVGSYNHDLIFQTDALPRPGESRVAKLHRAHGGKGFNQAIAANRLGADTLFIGAIGNDSFGEAAAAFASEEKLPCAWQRTPQATGLASVGIELSGENQILVAPGANLALSTSHVAQQQRAIESARVVITQLETGLDGPHKSFQSSSGIRILNPAPFDADLARALLPHTDIVTPNEIEFAGLIELFGNTLPADWQTHSEAQLQNWCRLLGVATVIITLGADGVFVSTPDAGQRIAGQRVKAVDTTGAGDAFNGALAAGLLRFDQHLSTAIEFANRAAAISVTRRGAAPSMPRLAELLD